MDLDKLVSEGYTCITGNVLVLKNHLLQVGEPKLGDRNGVIKPHKLFRSLFQPAITWLLNSFNSNITLVGTANIQEKTMVKEIEVWRYILIFMMHITGTHGEFKQALGDETLSERRFYTINKLLNCANQEFYTVLNQSFKEPVNLSGFMSLDETMWVWKSDHPAVIHIPRKPKGQGMKIFTFCFKFTTTDLPYLVHFEPDLGRPGLLASDVLDIADQLFANFPNIAITTDAWFSRVTRMVGANHVLCTTSLGNDEEQELTRVGGWRLKMHEYRVFQCGQRVFTIYQDNDLMRTATTCFDVQPLNPAVRPPQRAAAGVHRPLPPRLSVDAVAHLLKFDKPDLEVLASAFGESKGMS